MTADLATALHAMDVLNRWVRQQGVARPRKAVYWLKSRYAIRDAILAGMLSRFRLVRWTGKCNRCRNGLYIDWDGQERGACRHCNGLGRVTLKFVETTLSPVSVTIAGPFTWHTPLEYNSWHGWPLDDVEAVDVGDDWAPGHAGIELALEDAAALLNIVELRWGPQIAKHHPFDYSRDEWDDTRWAHFAYHLEIPAQRTHCVICGMPARGPGDLGHNCCYARRPGLSLTQRVCSTCYDDLKDGLWKRLESTPLPAFGPEMQAWIARHERIWGVNFRDENRRRLEVSA